MKKNFKIILVMIIFLGVFFAISIGFNYEDLTRDIYRHSKDIVSFQGINYLKAKNEDFSYLNIDKDRYEIIGIINKNNFFKDNIEVYKIDNNVIYIDPFDDHYNEEEAYLYGGLYIKESYFDDFIKGFDIENYYKDFAVIENLEPEKNQFTENETEILNNLLNKTFSENRYDGVKHDLSEYSYEIELKHNFYNDITLKVKLYRTKNNDIVVKMFDEIYYANEFKNNKDISENTSYYVYRGDDYGYLYNEINSDEDLIEFAFHDFILQDISDEDYENYTQEVFDIINNNDYSLDNKVSYIKQLLYSNYKVTDRGDFPLRIDRVKNLNIINDNRKTYRISHDFLFKLFNYPANLYSIGFYEDDMLYNIPERYKILYDNYVNIIINSDIDYLLKNDMIIDIQNELVVVDEYQLEEMKEKYGDIKVLEESVERIKYAPGYYGFLYDDIKNEKQLKDFALHFEVIENIPSEFFKQEYTKEIDKILNDVDKNLQEKLKEVMILQHKFTLIPLDKLPYYRDTYGDEYYKQSYIGKVKKIINS